MTVDNDTLAPETQGMSRRDMLVGVGLFAAAFGVGQLSTGAEPAYALPAAADFIPNTTGLPWPAWSEAELETAARTAAIRGANQFRLGGG